MATKTDEETAREAFKQELLHTSSWGLRRLATGPKGAGIEVAEMKKADDVGPEAVVELILEKYDEGWRPGGPALNPQSKAEAPKKSTKKAPAKKKEPEKEEEDNPWDDFGNDGEPLDIDGESEPEPEPKPEPEPEPEPKPKRARRTPKKAPAEESSALEEKVDKILDTLMKVASVISKLEKAINSVDDNVNEAKLFIAETRETTALALGGLFNRLSISNYGGLVKKAKDRAKKACGLE